MKNSAFYKRRLEIVSAFQWTTDMGESGGVKLSDKNHSGAWINSGEPGDDRPVSSGDWIITKLDDGETRRIVCSPEIFLQEYEEIK